MFADWLDDYKRYPNTTPYFVKQVLNHFGFTAGGSIEGFDRFISVQGIEVLVPQDQKIRKLHTRYIAVNSKIGEPFLKKLCELMKIEYKPPPVGQT